jgi:hypothetical protein
LCVIETVDQEIVGYVDLRKQKKNMKQLESISRTLLKARLLFVVIIVAVIAGAFTVTGLMQADDKVSQKDDPTADFWQEVPQTQVAAAGQNGSGRQVEIKASRFRAFTLNRGGMEMKLTGAPREFTAAARQGTFILSLPAPGKGFQRFAVQESSVMEPGLAAKHPDIKTYSGTGIDDPGATIRFDLTPLGFHASVRGPSGHWYIDPYFHLDQSVYAVYSRQDLDNPHGVFEEHEIDEASISASLPKKIASPLLPSGDQLRTYRLALITDPGYAAYFGGPANVTPAKVTLINRVVQLYEEDLSIRLVLVANNDLLNLDTWAAATGPNGPCGAAGCFTQSQVTGCASTSRARFVIGQIIGASNYDIGHLALGQPGGGVANLGVIGRSNKAGGCTGIPTPVGDYYAVDYVAHEMGHQFSGNHPFNGNQLNCSSGNRNASTSTEPGSGSSVMAYAGICLTDDLQRHSDPYFSARSQLEIVTYTTSAQAAINEVQTASLRHFGGGNEVQTVTFGPGFAPAATIQPLTVAIGGVPSSTQLGGLDETGNTVTVTTGATGGGHTLQVGDSITISGAGNAGYNGTFNVSAVLNSRTFQYANPNAGLPRSGGGTITLNAPGLTEAGNTVTVRTAAVHNRAVGDVVSVTGAGVAAYNGTWVIDSVPNSRSFTYTNPTGGLGNSGAGTVTFFSPFQLRIGGNDSVVINSANFNNGGITAAFAGISGFAGTATATGAASTGFTVTYTGAAANTDVPSFQIVNLNCGGCFSSVEETNHGGTNDSFTLNYNGNTSTPIVNGTSYTAAGLTAALTPILPAGATFTLNAFGGGNISGLNNTGFQVTYGGTLGLTNVPVLLTVTNFTAGSSGFTNETDKGGTVDNKGGIITPTGNAIPAVSAPAGFTIPLRTPFALTGSATDADTDPLVYSWEQTDRGAAAGIALLSNTKGSGPLFAMFPKSGQISDADALLYGSPGENALTTSPTRVFPDLQQVLDDNTNAATGSCPTGVIGGPVPQISTECFAEFLPTIDYVGFGSNAAPPSLHMRLTARDGKGGVDSADTTLTIDNTAGPLRVTSQAAPLIYHAGTVQNVTWDVNNTAGASLAPNVKISFSTDGGHTFPTVLSASSPNDGSEPVTIPYGFTTTARIKVEAVGNIFFDVNHSNFTVTSPTAADVSISGRVLTAAGTGLRNARVQLTDDAGNTRTALTNAFGYYSFDAVSAGRSYVIGVAAKRYTFTSQLVSIQDTLSDLNFVADQ